MSTKQKTAFADRKMLGRAIKDSFVKLSPKTQAKNPVMFLVFCGCYFDQHSLGGVPVRLKRRSKRIYAGDCSDSLVYRAICQFCRGHCKRRARHRLILSGHPVRT